MRKLIVVAAMLAMALLVAAPAVMADTTQTNTGDVVSQNVSDQDATQRQYAPGGDAQYNVEGDDDIEVDLETDTIIVDDEGPTGSGLAPQEEGDDDFDVVIIDFGDDESEVDTDVDQTGGDGGTQTIDQSNTQRSTATGPVFSAEQG